MLDRLPLYATAIRNQVGRVFGLPAAYAPWQHANAQTIFDFWEPKFGALIAAGWVADADREVSLNPKLVGDHGMAKDIAQMWPARRQFCQEHFGIDMANASIAEQCRGIYLEITDERSPYRHVSEKLKAAKSDTSVNLILIEDYERSLNHLKDLNTQLPRARYWLAQLGKAAA